MRICHITTVHEAFDVRIFHKECKTLARAGYDVVIIAQHHGNGTIDCAGIIPLPTAKNRLTRMLSLPIKALWLSMKQKAHVYHFHDPELIFIGILLKVFTNAKVIYDAHEDISKQIMSKYWIPKRLRFFASLIVGFTEKVCSRFFDGIITATDSILNNFSFHRNAVSVKNYPILSNFLNTKKKNKDDGVFKLVYVGCLSKIRGINQTIESLKYINSDKEVKLILCGEFSPPDYEREVRNIEGFEKVDYRGWIDPSQIPRVTSASDVGIVCLLPEPNYIDSEPIKLFEYMASGLPIIASNFPLWRAIVEGNNCGICVNPLNPVEIAQAIEYLMQHPEEAWKMGENGRKAAMCKYNWEKESEKLLDLYSSLLDKSKINPKPLPSK